MARFKLLYQIIFAILGVVFLTSLFLTTYALSVQRDLITTQLQRKGQVISQVLSRSVMDPLLRFDFYTIKLLFDPVEADRDVLSVSLTGPDNYIKMHTDLTRLGEPGRHDIGSFAGRAGVTILREDFADGRFQYAFLVPVDIDNNRIGLIEVVLSNDESARRIDAVEDRMLLLTGAVLIFGMAAAYLFSRQISRPLNALTSEMSSFSMMSHPPGHAGLGDPRNEIVILTETFQAMMDEIQESIAVRVRTEKMAVLGNLYAMLAHEIRNPLEPIKGSAELLRLTHPEDEAVHKYTGIIQSEVSELIGFLDSFLGVARGNEPTFSEVDLNRAIRDVVALLEYAAKKERIRIDLQLDPQLPVVSGDGGMLKHVILNAVLNAIQAKMGDSGLIEIRTGFDGTWVRIDITDHGVGIPAGTVAAVFQPFYTTRDDGSGIGLSTAKRIIDMHNGHITLTSQEGQWTLVEILLPRVESGSTSPDEETDDRETDV
jgi:signal transduction histidine kinase